MTIFQVKDDALLLARVEVKSGVPTFYWIKHIALQNAPWEDTLYESLPDDEEIAFPVSDLDTYLFRFDVPGYITGEALPATVLEKAREVLPEELEEFVYDFIILHSTEHSNTVLFAATLQKNLLAFAHILDKKNCTPRLVIPEIAAEFEVLKPELAGEGLTIFLKFQEDTVKVSFFDSFGPFLSLEEEIMLKNLQKDLVNSIKVVKERYGLEVNKIIVGGKRLEEIDPYGIKQIIDVDIERADKTIESWKENLDIPFESPKSKYIVFQDIIGVGLAASNENSLNLIRKEDASRLFFPLKTPSSQQEKSEEKELEMPKNKHNLASLPSIQLTKFFNRKIFIIAFVIIGSILALQFVKFLQTAKKPKVTQKPIVATKPTVTLTPTPTIDKTKISLEILNGSGIKGAAGDLTKTLKDEGFTSINAGNADAFDYTGVTIAVKPGNETLASLLKNDIKNVTSSEVKTTQLPESSRYDAIITLGK